MPTRTLSQNVTDLGEEILDFLATTPATGGDGISALGIAIRRLCQAMCARDGEPVPMEAFAGGPATEEILDAAMRHTHHAQLLCIYLATVIIAVSERVRQQNDRGELPPWNTNQGPEAPGIERETP